MPRPHNEHPPPEGKPTPVLYEPAAHFKHVPEEVAAVVGEYKPAPHAAQLLAVGKPEPVP